MYTDNYIAARLKECELQIAELEEKIASLPEGKLHIIRNGKYYTWKVLMPGKKRVYLPKSEEEKAKLLAQKNIYLARLHDLKCEAKACARFLSCEEKAVCEQEKLFEKASPELIRLAGDLFDFEDDKTSRWLKEPYERYTAYPERLIIPTLKEGERVRSKLEASAAGYLYTLKIPYKYEKITQIGGIKIAVDFTALDVRCGREIPIELFGMMDDPDYRKNYVKKMHTYINAGYIPGVNFLTFYESAAAPLNPAFMRKTLEDFFYKNPPQML